MQVALVLFRADGERRSFAVTRDITVIGRREDSDLRIPLAEVSRKHCRIIIENGNLRFEDFGSANGTFYNGRRVAEGWLKAGDSLQVGPVVFVVQLDGLPAENDMRPITSQAAATTIAPPPIATRIPAAAPASPPGADEGLIILSDDETTDQGGIPTGLNRVQQQNKRDDFDVLLDENVDQA